MIFECTHCGKEFKSYQPSRKFCSPACFHATDASRLMEAGLLGAKAAKKPRQKKPISTRPCVVCGSPISTRRIASCGLKCAHVLKSRTWKSKKPPIDNHVCFNCGHGFFSYNKNRKFCSYSCSLANGTAFRAGLAAGRSSVKYGAKKDANHVIIVDFLRSNGIPVYDLSGAGCGIPDCLVWLCNEWRLVEIKNPNTGYGRRGLNPIQKQWIKRWNGGPIYIIKSLADAERFARGHFDDVEVVKSGWVEEAVKAISI